MNVIQIIAIIIIILAILVYIVSNYYNKIKISVLRINSIESEIDTFLRNKYDLLVKLTAEVEKNDKKEKRFKDISKIKDEDLSSFEFERKLSDIESLIFNIKNDNEKLQKSNLFNDSWYEIINLNTKISASIKYYNDNITEYNLLVTKLPSKLIADILKYKEKKYFDDKNMYDKNTKDFKI